MTDVSLIRSPYRGAAARWQDAGHVCHGLDFARAHQGRVAPCTGRARAVCRYFGLGGVAPRFSKIHTPLPRTISLAASYRINCRINRFLQKL